MPCFFLKYSLPEWLASDLKSSVAAFYYVALFKKRVDVQDENQTFLYSQ